MNIKKRLLSDAMTAYVEKQFRAALRAMGTRDESPAIESELSRIERKIGRVLDAIESVGISDSLADRLQKLETRKQEAEDRLKAAQVGREPLDNLPDLVPLLIERWRALVADFEQLPSNQNVEPGEIDTARSHLHALLGQVTLKPKVGVLWAHTALKAEGLAEASPVPLILVAAA